MQTEKCFSPDDEDDVDPTTVIPVVGDAIDVFWSHDNQFYSGKVTDVTDGKHHVTYDDGDKETLDICKESWRFTNGTQSVQTAFASTVELKSSEQHDLTSMLKHFGNKPFLAHKAQGFPFHVLQKAYKAEEESFKKTVRVIDPSSVPAKENIISSHVLYKIKITDGEGLQLKARIAPHGNEDSIKREMRSDCSMCDPTGVRVLISNATVRKWRISKVDVKSAFLQTGPAERSVYVIPPLVSEDRFRSVWLLLAASYGLVNANAKFQVQSDNLLLDLGMLRVTDIPQLFYAKSNGRLTILLAKIVDDILVTGEVAVFENVLRMFNEKFKFGTIVHGPGKLRYFGFNVIQYDDYTTVIDGDDKLSALEPPPLSRIRRKAVDDKLNEVEKSAFSSLNSCIGWLGTTVSPFCAASASRLQQCLPDVRVSDMIKQKAALQQLKKLGSAIKFQCPSDNKAYGLSVLVFADAGRPNDSAQLSVICGLLIGPLDEGSVYHTVSWLSHKWKRPVRSIAAGEILAAGEGIDEGLVLKRTYSLLLDIP